MVAALLSTSEWIDEEWKPQSQLVPGWSGFRAASKHYVWPHILAGFHPNEHRPIASITCVSLHDCRVCCYQFLPFQGIWQCLSLVTHWCPLAFNRPRYLAGSKYHVDSATTAAAAGAQPLLTNLFELRERSVQHQTFETVSELLTASKLVC